ncbi:hypothetical protein C8R45DRAFT_566025 [Mycena sanguinolenta]|nr:hypothetical protein C8R45DRAFT_566025 [Mycena sanguinolenta]
MVRAGTIPRWTTSECMPSRRRRARPPLCLDLRRHPPQKKKEAHTTAVMNLPAEKQEWDWIPKGTDTRDPDVLQTAAEKKQMRMLWERERRKWGKAPPPVAEVMPPGAAEFQHSVVSLVFVFAYHDFHRTFLPKRTTPHPFHPSTSPSTRSPSHHATPFPSSPSLSSSARARCGLALIIDAQSTQTKLAGNADYTLQDLHADQRGRIHVRVDWEWFLPSLKWSSDSPLTYEIHLDVDDGRIIMEALLRRVARACVDYLESNMVLPVRPSPTPPPRKDCTWRLAADAEHQRSRSSDSSHRHPNYRTRLSRPLLRRSRPKCPFPSSMTVFSVTRWIPFFTHDFHGDLRPFT